MHAFCVQRSACTPAPADVCRSRQQHGPGRVVVPRPPHMARMVLSRLKKTESTATLLLAPLPAPLRLPSSTSAHSAFCEPDAGPSVCLSTRARTRRVDTAGSWARPRAEHGRCGAPARAGRGGLPFELAVLQRRRPPTQQPVSRRAESLQRTALQPLGKGNQLAEQCRARTAITRFWFSVRPGRMPSILALARPLRARCGPAPPEKEVSSDAGRLVPLVTPLNSRVGQFCCDHSTTARTPNCRHEPILTSQRLPRGLPSL